MENIAEILEGVKTMGIGGHIRPDGDCVGSCMALYLYVKTYYPEIQADVYPVSYTHLTLPTNSRV